MITEEVSKIANAVLYEGYLLYPYRMSSIKNRQRWTFGGLYPPAFANRAAESSSLRLELLVQSDGDPVVDVHVRFLHLLSRRDGGQEWQEAADRAIAVQGLSVSKLLDRADQRAFAFTQSVIAEAGILRSQERIEGSIEVAAYREYPGLQKLSIQVENTNPVVLPAGTTRETASLHALVAAHVITCVSDGEFISLTDPPEKLVQTAARCSNFGVWPVLAGPHGSHSCMLAAPIILPDYPEIAPESAGDLFDGTEIDEILTLRILTMTDAEKEEMRKGDERGRRLLERTEALSADELVRLHGALRNPHSKDAAAGGRK